MGKKKKFKSVSTGDENMVRAKLKFHSSDDVLHEGRKYGMRRFGMWSTYNAINKVCSDTAKEFVNGVSIEDCLGHRGEKI